MIIIIITEFTDRIHMNGTWSMEIRVKPIFIYFIFVLFIFCYVCSIRMNLIQYLLLIFNSFKIVQRCNWSGYLKIK